MRNDFFRVVLGWPNWDISPNGTSNRRYKSTLVREHRYAARMLATEAIGYQNWVNDNRLFSIWVFRQPNKRNRDTGNMRAAMKAYQDGVFDSLRIDDYSIKDEHLHVGDVVTGGEVELRIYEDWRQWIDDVIILTGEKYGGSQCNQE